MAFTATSHDKMQHPNIGFLGNRAPPTSSKSWPPQSAPRREVNPRPSNASRPTKARPSLIHKGVMSFQPDPVILQEIPVLPTAMRLCPCENDLLRRIDRVTNIPDPANIGNIEEIIRIHAEMITAGQRLQAACMQSRSSTGVIAANTSTHHSDFPSRTYAVAVHRLEKRRSRRESQRTREDEDVIARETTTRICQKSIEADIRKCEDVQESLRMVILNKNSKRDFQTSIERTLPWLRREYRG